MYDKSIFVLNNKTNVKNYFLFLIIFLCSCSNEDSIEEKKRKTDFVHENVFDTATGYWTTYAGILTSDNGKGINTRLTFFVSPFTGKLNFKITEKSLNKQRDKETRETKGRYITTGRYFKKQYLTIYQFINEKNKNEGFYFLRTDDNTLIQLNNSQKKFDDRKPHTLKKEN